MDTHNPFTTHQRRVNIERKAGHRFVSLAVFTGFVLGSLACALAVSWVMS